MCTQEARGRKGAIQAARGVLRLEATLMGADHVAGRVDVGRFTSPWKSGIVKCSVTCKAALFRRGRFLCRIHISFELCALGEWGNEQPTSAWKIASPVEHLSLPSKPNRV